MQRTGGSVGRLLALAALIGILAVTACAAGSGERPKKATANPDQPRTGGRLRVAIGQDPPHLDFDQTYANATMQIASLVYNRLVKFRSGPDAAPFDTTVVPDLAEKWESDGKVWTFHLRKGVHWHNKEPINGRELVADDVKYSFDRLINSSPYKHLFENVEQVDVVDTYTIRFTLKEPFAPFLAAVAAPVTWVTAPEIVELNGDLKNVAIGTGPYVLDDFQKGFDFNFSRNKDYFEPGRPYIDQMQVLIQPDEAERLTGLRAGEVDVLLDGVPAGPAKKLKDTGVKLNEDVIPSLDWPHFYFRLDKDTPFSDKRVRQALSLALDRNTLIQKALGGEGLIEGPIPAAHKDWALPIEGLGDAGKYYRRNVEQAKALLADAGQSQINVKLYSASALGASWVATLEQARLQLRDVGINVELEWQDLDKYLNTTHQGRDFEGIAAGPTPQWWDVDGYLHAMHTPGLIWNQSHVNDPVLSDLIAKQRQIVDVAQRKRAVEEIQRYLADQQYYVTLPTEQLHFLYNPQVKRYRPSPIIGGAIALTDAWLQRL